MTEPRDRIMDILHAPLVTHMVAAAAELGIADLVADRPRGVEDLALRTGVDADALHRVLRALVAAGIFQEAAPRVYGATPLSATLRTGVEGSMRDWARLWSLPERNAALGGLLTSLRTGRPAFEELYQTTWWDHLSQHPEQSAVFRDAMGDLSRGLHAAAVSGYDLSGRRLVVDIGGGTGQLVAEILKRYPEMSAVLFDRPAVVEHAPPVLAAAGVADRVRVEGGDFFDAVPAGGDAYLLSMILHDWSDEQCVRVLSNVRRVLPDGGEVLVIDAVVPADGTPHDGKLRDVIMLALHPGRERTESEFATLFERSGLRHKETLAVTGSTGLVVAGAA